MIAGFVFMIVLYNMAISDTINLVVENSRLSQEVSDNADIPKQIQQLKQRLNKLEKLVGNKKYEDRDIHQVLLESVTGYVQKNRLVLKDFPQPYVIADKGYITKTAKVTVEGDFIHLLRLTYFLENNYKVGKVIAVDFSTTKELRTRKRKLNSIIYLQNVKAENYEENT